MSSKSRNKPTRKSPPTQGTGKAAGTAVAPTEAEHGHELADAVEEVIHVPTGRNPLRFLLMVLLVILLTAIFAINPGVFQRAASGSADAFMTWEHPTEGKLEVSGQDFLMAKRDLDHFLRLFGGRPDDEDTARFLVLDGLAVSAGINVTDAELAEQLRQLASSPAFQDSEALKAYMRRSSGGIPGFQERLRQQLRGQRYVQLLAYFAANPDGEEIEAAWREDHQEHAFDYAELEVASLMDEARAMVPDDEGEEGLRAWLESMDELDQAPFQEPERMRAELAGFLFDGAEDAAGLLERYPDPGHGDEHDHEGEEGEDAEAEPEPEHDHEGDLARSYFDRVRYWRFERPVPEGEDPPVDFQERYFEFADIEQDARAEAPVYGALERWMSDLRTRAEAGEEIDLEAEAEELGLAYRAGVDTLSASDWGEVAGWGGSTLGARLGRLEPQEFSPVLMVEKGAMSVGRLLEKVDAYLPEFEVVRDDVAEAWAERRARELAVEKLVAVRDSFEALEDETDEDDGEPLPHASEGEFAEAVAALGLELARRPHMERATAFSEDPDSDLAGHVYIRTQTGLLDLEEGEIAEPTLAADEERAFLVRHAGTRDPEAWKMSPLEYDQSIQSSGFRAYSDFVEANFGFEALTETYSIWMDKVEEEGP